MILCLGLVNQTKRNPSATHNQELVCAIVHLVDLLDIVFVCGFVDSIAAWIGILHVGILESSCLG